MCEVHLQLEDLVQLDTIVTRVVADIRIAVSNPLVLCLPPKGFHSFLLVRPFVLGEVADFDCTMVRQTAGGHSP